MDTNKVSPADICIFELSNRVGGRIYSVRGLGPEQNLVVDAGAYRTWPEYTPVTQALITDYLGLSVGCYDPAEDPCGKFNIVDADGEKSGFATYVEVMMERLTTAGVRWFPHYELDKISQTSVEGTKTLTFTNGATSIANTVILGIPQRPLLKVLRASSLPSGALTSAVFTAMHSVQTEIVSKVYLYYENAWWYDLGLTSGEFYLEGDALEMPLKGRYHDGHVRCDSTGKCSGFLQSAYIHDFGGETALYFRRYQSYREEPITIISSTDPDGANFLNDAHERLKTYHIYHQNAVPPFQARQKLNSAPPPTFAVLATWNIATKGAGCGWHGWTSTDLIAEAMDPLGAYGIHVINEAYSLLQGWSEGTLMAADAALNTYFEVPRPWSFDNVEMNQVVRQTKAETCEAADEPDDDGGSDSGGSSGGGGNSDVLCFSAEALLQLANGSHVPIHAVRKGDEVWTGKAKGTVTAALVHKVGGVTDVAVVKTATGDLVGTPSHPVSLGGQWLEIKEAFDAGLLSDVSFERRYIDSFYNLEVDADRPGESEHAYVVHGIVASGLGDNAILNERYPRQQSWKVKVGESGFVKPQAS